MSKIENLKKVLKKVFKKERCYDNALKNNKNALKSVTIKFYNIFRRKTSF